VHCNFVCGYSFWESDPHRVEEEQCFGEKLNVCVAKERGSRKTALANQLKLWRKEGLHVVQGGEDS